MQSSVPAIFVLVSNTYCLVSSVGGVVLVSLYVCWRGCRVRVIWGMVWGLGRPNPELGLEHTSRHEMLVLGQEASERLHDLWTCSHSVKPLSYSVRHRSPLVKPLALTVKPLSHSVKPLSYSVRHRSPLVKPLALPVKLLSHSGPGHRMGG